MAGETPSREVSIERLPRLTRWTVAAIIRRAEDSRPPAACYDCHQAFMELKPWNGRLLCGLCTSLAKLRRR